MIRGRGGVSPIMINDDDKILGRTLILAIDIDNILYIDSEYIERGNSQIHPYKTNLYYR